MNSSSVYIVIVTYNPKKWIDQCFSSLRNSTIPLKTIVIDNGSTDGSQLIIQEKYPEVDFIEAKQNLGFGKGNNIGIRKAYDAGADFVFLLNQDAWIENNTIEKLVEVANQNPEFGIISPMHLNGSGSTLDYNFSYYIATGLSKTLFSDMYLNTYENKIYSQKFVNAAAWLITRKCIENVGGFSPSFFHYSEDDNYCQRVLYHGFKIGVVPMVKIYHDRDSTKKGVYFTDFKLNFKREMIAELSNPHKMDVLKFLFRRVRIQDWKDTIVKLKIIRTIDFKSIVRNKKLSKIKGQTFL
ncbi:glycosyltransferase family 2 protein [Flavobacterium sp.]|uniref:glycosyltransferase family 2 protein n=1 Tax=Flavobacterium sp. TaxID=239 RepID=UPI0038FCAC13